VHSYYVHGVLIVDVNRTILFANPAAEGIFDSKEKGLQGRPFEFAETWVLPTRVI